MTNLEVGRNLWPKEVVFEKGYNIKLKVSGVLLGTVSHDSFYPVCKQCNRGIVIFLALVTSYSKELK